jgi:hypothetical protein
MRKSFAALDEALIERLFQPVADSVSYRIRVSRGAAVCFCLDLASVSWIVSRAGGLSGALFSSDATAAFLSLSFLLLGLLALTSLRTLFRRTRGKQGNPLRPAMRPHRAIMLLMLASQLARLQAPGVAEAADIAMLAFATAALYLGACAERPQIQRVVAPIAVVS